MQDQDYYFQAFSSKFRQMTYGDYIKQYILNDAKITSDALIKRILGYLPADTDPKPIKKLLSERLHLNAGIVPIALTEQGNFVIAGVSQREGNQKRGVLINAMGKTDPEDTTLAHTAVRELYEELGLDMGRVFSKNLRLAKCTIKNKLGSTLEEVAQNLLDYSQGKRSSISLSASIAVPVKMTADNLASLTQKTNDRMSPLAKKYHDIVNILIPRKDAMSKLKPEHFDEYISFANNIKKLLPVDVSLKISQILEKIEHSRPKGLLWGVINSVYDVSESARKELLNLLSLLIDVTENERIVLVEERELARLCEESKTSDSRLIRGSTNTQENLEFFKASLKDVANLFTENSETLFDELEKNCHQYGSYGNVTKSIESSSTQDLSRHANHVGVLVAKHISIIKSFLTAGRHQNPRSLTVELQQQLSLGDLYFEHCKQKGSFLKDTEIPSHVSAAQTDERVAAIKCMPGTLLYQFVRPNGYIGDYYAGTNTATPNELGTSEQVSDPEDDTKVVDRVKLEFVVVDQDGYDARVSTAKPVKDFWSIKNKTVFCDGGGEQFYSPLPVTIRQQGLVIVKPSDPNHVEEVVKVAKKNGLKILSKQEIKSKYHIRELKEPYSREHFANDAKLKSLDFDTLQRYAYEALTFGNYQTAVIYLEHALSAKNASRDDKRVLKCLLGCLYSSVGKSGKAQKLLDDFLKNYEQEDQNSKLKYFDLEFLLQFYMARMISDPLESIRKLKKLKDYFRSYTQYFEDKSLLEFESLVNLEIGLRYNQIASRYSDEITYHDFDTDGEKVDTKFKYSRNAELYLSHALEKELPTQEKLLCMTELAQAYHKQKKNLEAIKLLRETEAELVSFISQVKTEYSQSAIKDLEMQLIGVRLGIGLNIARCKDADKLPLPLQNANPVDYLNNIAEELKNMPPMKVKLIFNRWVGPNANNLFIQGWFRRQKQDKTSQGSSLIGLFRKYIPLDINKICNELKNNMISELDIAYLGMDEPAGINDEDFNKLTEALAENTSLKRLFIRKFSRALTADELADQNNELQHRPKRLFDALTKANANGQQLEYLSYSGARFNTQEDFLATVNFLTQNQSLKILQPALHDWKDPVMFNLFAQAIKNHPSLRTMLTGIFKIKDGGEMLYNAGLESKTLRYVYPFPGKICDDPTDPGVINKEWLIKLRDKLNVQYQEKNTEGNCLLM